MNHYDINPGTLKYKENDEYITQIDSQIIFKKYTLIIILPMALYVTSICSLQGNVLLRFHFLAGQNLNFLRGSLMG